MDNKFCPDCKTEKNRNSFGKETASKDGLRYICKSCNSKRALEWHNKNKDHVNARERAFYAKDPTKKLQKQKKWRLNNPEKVADSNKKRWKNRDVEESKKKINAWVAKNKDKKNVSSKRDYQKNKEKRKSTRQEWERKNKGKRRALVAKRRAIKIRATPRNMTIEDWEKINLFYELAWKMTEVTGINHEVDHIFPLNSDIVSGFHHWNNLQVLTAEQNRSKSNKIRPDIVGFFPEGLSA